MRFDLIDNYMSQITYTIKKFPDGQRQIRITTWNSSLCKRVYIKTRLSKFSDFELLYDAVGALRRKNPSIEIELVAPYILGSRSDIQFLPGESSYFVDVIAPLINNLNFVRVNSFTPHSTVMQAAIKNFRGEEPSGMLNTDLINNYKWICPDAGAEKRMYKLAENKNKKLEDIIFCTKHRNKDGNIETRIPNFKGMSNPENKYLIIDDICDGGGTFLGIAGKFKSLNLSGERMELMVTHGMFNKGLKILSQAFDVIHTTNSYQSFSNCSRFAEKNEESKKLLKITKI